MATAIAGALAPAASAVVVHGRGGQFLGVAPRADVAPAAIPGSVAATRAARNPASGSSGALWENLDYQGGPVLHSSRPYLIYWAPTGETISAAWQSLTQRYFTDVAADSTDATNVYGVARQFTDATGFADYRQTFDPATQVVQDNNPYPTRDATNCGPSPYTTCLTDGQLQAEISNLITANGLPTDGPNSAAQMPDDAPIYFVVLPGNVDVCWSDGTGTCATNYFCAYHSSYVDGSSDVLYAAIPSVALNSPQDAKGCQWDGNSLVQEPNGNIADVALKYISHEDNETITDPLGTGWWSTSMGNENGDNCNDSNTDSRAFTPTLGGDPASGTLYNQLIGGDQYYLQSEWSNGSGSCAMQPDGGAITPRFSVPAGPRSAGSALTFDPSTSTSTYRFSSETWSFGDGTAMSFHAGQTLTSATHTYASPGDYSVTLTLVDNRGDLTTATEQISVGSGPSAAINGFPTTLQESSGPVNFDASASTDTGASIVSYAWDFGDGATAQGASASHTYATAGTYLARLTVTDSLGHVDTATSTVTVLDEPLLAAFAIGATAPVTGQPVPFDASASADSDGSIVAYAWSFGDGQQGTGQAPTHAYATPGTYPVTLTVTDSSGQNSSVTHTVAVGPDEPPAAAFVTTPSVAMAGAPVTFDAGGSTDPDGAIAFYIWDFGDGGTGAGPTLTHTYATAGTYTVALTVIDSGGETARVSEPVTVQVVTPSPPVSSSPPPAVEPPPKPIAAIAVRTARPAPGRPVSFSGSPSRGDEPIVSYIWHFGGGRSAAGRTVAHTFARDGSYRVWLTVRDSFGNSATTSTMVTVRRGVQLNGGRRSSQRRRGQA